MSTIDTSTTSVAEARRQKGLKLAAITPRHVDTMGVPKFVIDSETVKAQYRHKDYIVSIGWALDPNTGRADGCMTIWSARPDDDAGAWVLMRRCMGEFSDEHNRPTVYAFEQALEALPVLGRSLIKTEVHNLIDTILAYVDDVVMLGAAPVGVALLLQGDPVWDVTVHANEQPNKVLREATI